MSAPRLFHAVGALGICLLSGVDGHAQMPPQTASATGRAGAQRNLSAALSFASKGRYKDARPLLEKADAEQPGTFAILFNLGQVYLQLGDYAKAERALSAAQKLSVGPQDTAATLYLLAQVDARQSRPLDALDALVRARKLDPRNVDILFSIAQISMARNYFEDAIPVLEEAAAIAPGRMDVQTALGESYFKADEIERSIDVFTALAKRRKDAEDHDYLGLAHTHLGRLAEAKQDFHEALAIAPNDSFCLFQLAYVAGLQGDTLTEEATLLKVLRSRPDYPPALLELANLRAEAGRYAEARDLLQRSVILSPASAPAWYRLARVEKMLHHDDAAQHDLAQFQTASRQQSESTHPYDRLLDYLDTRSQLTTGERAQQDVATLEAESKAYPDQPEVSYALAEAYLKAAKLTEARQAVAAFDEQHPGDVRTLTGLGVLLARHGMYQDAISQFERALSIQPDADDTRFDLATAYFRMGEYAKAASAAETIGDARRNDDAYAALMADIAAHLGETQKAEELYRSAVAKNPDNDQAYLSLAMLEFQQNRLGAAKETLEQGRKRLPASGKISWGLGLAAVLAGETALATDDFERAVELVPEWPASYSTLGFFYFQTGQVAKAREVLERFRNSGTPGGFDLSRIESALDQAAAHPPSSDPNLGVKERLQVLQLAVFLVDRTL